MAERFVSVKRRYESSVHPESIDISSYFDGCERQHKTALEVAKEIAWLFSRDDLPNNPAPIWDVFDNGVQVDSINAALYVLAS